MGRISDVRQLLRSLSNLAVAKKKNGVFPFKVGEMQFQVSESVIDHYLSIRDNLVRPHETAISIPGYYEQALDFQGGFPIGMRIRRGDAIEMENKEKSRKITVSRISDLFALVLLDCEELSEEMRRYFNLSRIRQRHERGEDFPNSVGALLGRIRTVKIETKPDDLIATSPKRLLALCESALFHVAYGWATGISLSTSWERAYYRFGLRRKESVQFPLRTYNSELIAYYHLAFGSDSLILAYLALYKILEYFFTSAAERLLHNKIKDKLVQPDFLHTKARKLRELVNTIRAYDSRMDEKRMLTTVLTDYFNPEELRSWINFHESETEEYFTKERQVFAEPLRIDTSNDQIFATVAQRIYHIRNALVHYKEGEVSRFIPFSGQEKVLFREIPLLLFLAEQLILKTGKDI
jgi:hypothetical protein